MIRKLSMILLSFMLMFGMLPMTAMAGDAPFVSDATFMADENVCAIGETQYATLDDALINLQSGDKITLLKDIDYNKVIEVTNHIIFDVGEYTLNITNPNADGAGLTVSSASGRVSLLSTTGELNVTGGSFGVKAWGGANVTVTNATATKPSSGGNGVAAWDAGTEVTVKGNVQATANGVYVMNSASVLVQGDIIGEDAGIYSDDGSAIVRGQVTGGNHGVLLRDGGNILAHKNIQAEKCGAYIENGGTVNIKGPITVTGTDGIGAYLRGSISMVMTIDGTITAPNYIKLSDSIWPVEDGVEDAAKPGYLKYSDGDDRVIWVKSSAPADVFEVGTPEELETALGSVPSGGTIRLTANIDYNKGVSIDKSFTLDLQNYNLTVANDTGTGLKVQEATLTVAGAGDLNVTGKNGVRAYKSTVTVARATGTDGYGALAQMGGKVTVKNTARGTKEGAYATGVDSKISADEAVATAVNGRAVLAELGGMVTVSGNVIASEGYGVYCLGGTQGGTVDIGGNATGKDTAVYLYGMGTVQIGGGAFTKDGGGTAVTVDFDNGSAGTVTVDGAILASVDNYMLFSTFYRAKGEGVSDPAKPGYLKYMSKAEDGFTGGAVWVKIPVLSYPLTVTNGTGGGSYAEGSTVTITADPAPAGQRFTEWNITPSVPFVDSTSKTSQTAKFTMPAQAVTATAMYDEMVPPTGGSGSSGGRSSAPVTPTYQAVVSGIGALGTTLPINVNAGSAEIDLGSPAGAVFAGEDTAVITIPSIPGVSCYTLGIPATYLSGSQGEGALTFSADVGSITIPAGMLAGIADNEGASAGITIARGDKSGLPDGVKGVIGDRPIVQLTLTMDGTQIEWNNPNRPVTVSIPYIPTQTELANPDSIVIWCIYGNGKAVSVPNGRYDSATGTVTFTTTHFSRYAVSYNQVSFKDVAAGSWYAKAVSFIAAREITAGTGNGNFSPQAKLTRSEFIVMLMRTYNIAPDVANQKDNFADAGSTWYTSYLGAAKRLGISAGAGNNLFAPEKEITRQEMCTLLCNALKAIGQLPQGNSGKMLSSFSDAGNMAVWAKDAMKLLVENGTICGSNGKLFPTGTTTRAEMAQVLYKLLSK